MRIAHVSATFPPYLAGTGLVCYQNARGLAQSGHDVHVFTASSGGAPAREQVAGFTLRRLRARGRFGNAPFTPALLQALAGFDIIHLHYPYIFGDHLARLAAAIHRTPLAITFHNDLIGDGARAPLFSAYQTLSARLVVRFASALAVVSEDHLAASRLRGQVSDRHPALFEVPNSIDTTHFRPVDGAAVRGTYGIPAAAPLLLFVAALDRAHHFKRLDLLIEAMAGLPEDVWLLVVGEGELRAQWERMAAQKGLDGRVLFAGRIHNDDLPPLYSAADATVLPSSPPESFGLVLLESLACGTPVLASDIPGVRTVIDPGVDGLLCRPGSVAHLRSSLQQLLAMPPEERQRMGRCGRDKVVARYAAAGSAARLQAMYEQMLA